MFLPWLSQPTLVVVRQVLYKLWLLLVCVPSPASIMFLFMDHFKLLMVLYYELCLADSIRDNPSHASTCFIWNWLVMFYHACSLVFINVCLVTRDVGLMIFWIGYWECVVGVIHIISTCKTIVYILKILYLFVWIVCVFPVPPCLP